MADAIDKLAGDSGAGTAQLEAIIGLLRKRKWLILTFTAAATIVTVFSVSKQPKRYEATASIVIDLSVPQYLGADFRDVVEVEPSWWHSRETLETEFRTLRSHSQALAVAKALCGRTFKGGPAIRQLVPGINCQDGVGLATAAPLLQGMLRVTPVKDSRIVELTVGSESPEFAALVANTVAQVYAEGNLERRLSHSAGAATWLGDEYHQLLAELSAADQALIDFKKSNNVVAVSLEDDQNEQSTLRRKLADALSEVEVKFIGMKAARSQLLSEGNDPLMELTPALAENPIAQKLKELYIEEYGKLIALQGKYLERHPATVAQETRVANIKKDLSRELELARKAVDYQYNTLSKQGADLRAALDRATKESIRLEEKTSEYHRLKRELDRLVKLADQVGGRGRETALASQLKTNNVRVLDRARTPSVPVAPNVPRAAGVAAAASLFMSLAFALLLEALDKTVKTQEDVERAVGLTFLGIIPSIEPGDPALAAAEGPDGLPKELYILNNPNSAVAECCRAIRTNLLFMTPDKPARTMLVTSGAPQEGKTTVAVNLAITIAQSGRRVLLVDTDLRRPRLHKVFGIASGGQGLSSAIVGETDLHSAIVQTQIERLSILPCGPTPPNPAELLHAERFRRSVAELAAAFDMVIFDSPPINAVTDAAILARLTDATVLVAKAGRTTKAALNRSRRQLGGDSKVNLLGCIMNDISLAKQRQYGYYYYYSRYGYYAAPQNQAAAPLRS